MNFIESLIPAFLAQVIAYSAFLLYKPKHVGEIKKGSEVMRSLNTMFLTLITMLWLVISLSKPTRMERSCLKITRESVRGFS